MKKNVANQSTSFQMMTPAGVAVGTGTPQVFITGDNGTQATGGGTATYKGNGEWSYVFAQAETNYDHIAATMVLATAVSQTLNLYPNFPQTGDAFARLGAPSGSSVSGDIAAIGSLLGSPTGSSVSADIATLLAAAGNLSATTITAIQTGLATEADITALNNISVADIIGAAVEGTLDVGGMLRVILAAVAAISTGAGTGTINFRDQANTKNRISATVDSNGNRTAITVNGT